VTNGSEAIQKDNAIFWIATSRLKPLLAMTTIKRFIMGKKQKLYNLRANISIESQYIKYLLEHVIYKSDSEVEKDILSEIALEKSEKISRMAEKIGKILNH
jgi:hypothetical protein